VTVANIKFQNAINRVSQNCPPVWMMRQAGRYHQHYQKLKEKYSFMDLCLQPELAAEVAMGPMRDFDFDVAILFSDLLFPLKALGMGLEYNPAPKLGWHLETSNDLKKLKHVSDALPELEFQKLALQCTRQVLPKEKSLIGFVGGPWTLFAYATQGAHEGGLLETKKRISLWPGFSEVIMSLLKENIRLQLEGGAEVVMVFDTSAGELDSDTFNQLIGPSLMSLAKTFPGKLGYYSKGTVSNHIETVLTAPWAGFGVDHRWDIQDAFGLRSTGFVQGNFDQAWLHLSTDEFKLKLGQYLSVLKNVDPKNRAGWVCGLGHGVLQRTPEKHVRYFVDTVRETFT
jgi:uroporphyrinogen decarboxylase